jgi:ribosomal-protein-alanine N-acetyltransferase
MLQTSDLDSLMSIVGDPDVMKFLGVDAGVVLNREEAEDALHRMIAFSTEHGFGRWAVLNKQNNSMVGLSGFRLLEGTPELFYAFAKDFWGQGFATESARACLRYGFEELGFDRIVAATRHENAASINVMKRIGMTYEKEIDYLGVAAVCYVATRETFVGNNSTYVLT